MIGGLAALILLSTLSQTKDVPHQISLTVAELGNNFTLTCPLTRDKAGLFYWFKLKFGYMVQTVAAGTFDKITLKEQFDNSKFTVTKGDAQYFLKITNVSKEDEATYFCQAGSAYTMKFISGTLLAVNDHKNQQKPVYVRQSPETESGQPGGSVTLQCSLLSKNKEDQCPGEHSVYWFRAGSGESHPGVINTHRNSSDEQEERSCVYSLSKTIHNSSDTGTYYCAVVTCGEILFGEGTKVETNKCLLGNVADSGSELDPVVLVLGVLLACCVTVIAVLIFYVNQKKVCEHCKGAMSDSHHLGHDKSTVDQSNDLAGEARVVNNAALDFSTRKMKRGKKKDEYMTECMYCVVRADCHNQQHPSL